MNDAHTVGAHLSNDSGPRLLLGRPVEGLRGLLHYPALVVGESGAWLAIGHVEDHARWSAPVVKMTAMPTAARVAVDVVAHRAVRSWGDRLHAERFERQRLAVLEAQRASLVAQRATIDNKIADLDRAIAEANGAATC